VTAALAQRVREARTRVDRESGAWQELARSARSAMAGIAALEADAERHERVARLLTTIGEERQESAQRQIEALVSMGLQKIFGEELTFHLVQASRGSQPVVDFVVRSSYGGEVVETPVLDARGGGLAVVVAFILRLVVLLLTPGARRLIVLDESFSHVSAEYETAVADFLREICDRAGVQIIMVTHSTAYDDAADRRYRLEQGTDGVTHAREG